MQANIKLNKNSIAKIQAVAENALVKTIKAVHADVVSSQVMPFDTGDMQNNQTFTNIQISHNDLSATIVTSAPQARRLYYHPEYNFQQGKNYNAGCKWFDSWIDGDKKDFVKDKFAEELQEALK